MEAQVFRSTPVRMLRAHMQVVLTLERGNIATVSGLDT